MQGLRCLYQREKQCWVAAVKSWTVYSEGFSPPPPITSSVAELLAERYLLLGSDELRPFGKLQRLTVSLVSFSVSSKGSVLALNGVLLWTILNLNANTMTSIIHDS